MSWGGKYVIFTSSKDCHVRAFTIENGNDVKLQAKQPTPNTWVNKFMTLPNDQIFCGLNNGKFLIWDLSSNTTQEDDGHGQNRSITNIIKH